MKIDLELRFQKCRSKEFCCGGRRVGLVARNNLPNTSSGLNIGIQIAASRSRNSKVLMYIVMFRLRRRGVMRSPPQEIPNA